MQEATKITLIAAVVSAVAALIGALGGAYIGGDLARRMRDEDRAIEKQRFVLEQRQRLLERLSVIANLKGRGQWLRQLVEDDAELYKVFSNCKERAKGNVARIRGCQKLYDPYASLGTHKEYVELHANYVSTLQLAKTYFGKDVVASIEKLTASQKASDLHWCEISGDDFVSVLTEMRKDVEAVRF